MAIALPRLDHAQPCEFSVARYSTATGTLSLLDASFSTMTAAKRRLVR